jgi:hypothetical protein
MHTSPDVPNTSDVLTQLKHSSCTGTDFHLHYYSTLLLPTGPAIPAPHQATGKMSMSCSGIGHNESNAQGQYHWTILTIQVFIITLLDTPAHM